MNVEDTIKILLEYYVGSRGIGHTKLLREGVSNFQGTCRILVNNMDDSKLFTEELRCSNVEVIPIYNLEREGIYFAMAVDNHVFVELLRDILSRFKIDESEIRELKRALCNIRKLCEQSI